MIEFGKTSRGFELGSFKDRYQQECSIQDSSLATEPAIWLGVDKMLSRDGLTEVHARMHLTVPQAKELVAVPERFIEKGTICP